MTTGQKSRVPKNVFADNTFDVFGRTHTLGYQKFHNENSQSSNIFQNFLFTKKYQVQEPVEF